MSVSKEDILNAVAEMSVMDVVELVEAMEEKFGVSAAAAVAAAPVAGALEAKMQEVLRKKMSSRWFLLPLEKKRLTRLKWFVPLLGLVLKRLRH